MNVRPNVKKLDRPGLQGGLSFDPTNQNLDVQLFKDLKKLIQGDLGLGGAGGSLANRVNTTQSFQASHVFDSTSQRDSVTQRLNNQLTEKLQEMVGERAQKANQSIPNYLQAKGIRGIQETEGGKLTAYRPDNFKKVTQNPITGSTERLMKAAMKGFGSVHEVSGGTNEKRTISAYLRPEEAAHVNKMPKTAADKIAAGTYNMGQMEAFYASTKQRETFKAKQRTSKNDLVTEMIADDNNVVTQEVKSRILKQSKQKEKFTQVTAAMKASGELPEAEDKTKEKKDDRGSKGSSSAAIFKSAMNTVMQIGGYVQAMVGLLSRIAIELGKTIAEGQSAGLDPNTADRFVRYAKLNKVFHADNAFSHLNAANALQAGFGDKELMGKHEFSGGERSGAFAGMIDPLIAHSDHLNMTQTMDSLYAVAAKHILGSRNKTAGMAEAKLALTRYTGNASVAESFGAMYNTELGRGAFTEANTEKNRKYVSHLVSNATTEGNLRTTSTGAASPFHGDELINSASRMGSAQDLNAVFHDIQLAFEGFRDMLLNRTDVIKRAFNKLIDMLLDLAVFLGISGAKDMQDAKKEAEKPAVKNQFVNQLINSAKFQAVGDDILFKRYNGAMAGGKKLTPEQARKHVSLVRNAIQEGDLEKVKSLDTSLAGDDKTLVPVVEAYLMSKKGFDQANESQDNLREGRSSFEGKAWHIQRDAAYSIQKVFKKWGMDPYHDKKGKVVRKLDKTVKAAESKKLPKSEEEKIKSAVEKAADKEAKFGEGWLWRYKDAGFNEQSSLLNKPKSPSEQGLPGLDDYTNGLAAVGAKSAPYAKAAEGMTSGQAAQQSVAVGTNVHITLGGKTILNETNLATESQKRDYYANV